MKLITTCLVNTLLLVMLVACNACQTKIQDETSFYRWLNEEGNGLVKTKHVNNLSITVKYLPASLLAYRELKSIPQRSKIQSDSLLRFYKQSHTFLLTLRPDKEKGAKGDVMYKDIETLQQYQQRALQLNFDMDEFIEVKTETEIFKPVLHTLENTYGVVEARTIYLVFAENELQKGLLESKTLDFTFADPFFKTGLHHFVFRKKDIDQVPEFDFFD